MRVKRAPSSDKVELNMTPMIDIVFQLLTFFLFSIKTVDSEGSFTIKMPTPSTKISDPLDDPAFPKPLVLTANDQGWLTSVKFLGGNYPVPVPAKTDSLTQNEKQQGIENSNKAFAGVHSQVRAMLGNTDGAGTVAGGAKALEIELDCSPNLKYSYVIQAINAVSGHRQPDGTITPLIEKIKFKPRSK